MTLAKDFAELGSRIRLVRLASGLSQQDLAAELGVDRTAISRIETGERRINAVELLRLAARMKVTLADLIELPSPDVVAARHGLEEESAGSEQSRSRAEIQLDRALRDAEQLRALGVLAAVRSSLGGAGLESPEQAAQLAQQARQAIGNIDGPLGPIADVAAEFGLWCRTTTEKIDGLSLTPEPGFGVALVGEGLEPGRRRATVAHELGHHLCGDTYETASHYAAPRETERLIDVFAGEFLLPSGAVRSRLSSDPSREGLVKVAADFRVSWTLLLHACARAQVPVVKDIAALTPVRQDFLSAVGAEPAPDLVAPGLPRQWVKACAQAVTKGMITPRRASELSLGEIDRDAA